MKKARILIVEDEAIITMEIESQLQGLGYKVTSIVDTGEKAIKKAEEDKPDIILMDIRIKGEMDGIEAAEEIRNKFGIPVIFLTAYLDEERIERAKITMPFGYVLKPIQERDLKVTIEMALYVSKADAERRKAEEVATAERERLSMLLESIPGFIYLQAQDYSIRYANKYFTDLFGEPKGRLCHEVLWDRKEPCEVCPTFEVYKTKMPQTWDWSDTPDGKNYKIYDFPFKDSDNSELVLEIGIDNTDLKTAEEKIKTLLDEKENLQKELNNQKCSRKS